MSSIRGAIALNFLLLNGNAMLRSFAFILVFLLAGPAQGAAEHVASIKAAVTSFVMSQATSMPGEVSVEIGEIDPNLTLPACPVLTPFLGPGSRLWGNSTIGVKCEGKWTIYIPVKVRVMADVVFSARPLSQGMVVSPLDVMLRKSDLAQAPPGALTDIGEAVGKTMISSIPPGYPMRMDMLRAPLIIRTGQPVRLVSKGKGFQVTAQGVALGEASEGQSVQVRTSSGRVVSGIARPGPYVEVTF